MPRHSSHLAAPALALLALIAGCSPASAPSTSTSPSAGASAAAPAPAPSSKPAATLLPAPDGLPRGGTEIFPAHRLIGYVGYPGDANLGRLGAGDVDARMAELEKQSAEWAGGRKPLPVMELLVSLAEGKPGPDGMYRLQASDDTIRAWLNVARRHKALLLLDIQPGRADFLPELKRLERWLAEPDVGVALDPEWAVDASQTPGAVFGNTTGKELDACASYLSDLVKAHHLPAKVMVYHVLHPTIVRDEAQLTKHPGVVLIKSVDGIGSPKDKVTTWNRVLKATSADVHPGFKLFFRDDVVRGGRLMSASEVLGLKPEPEFVMFE